jgi:hypothetical protein
MLPVGVAEPPLSVETDRIALAAGSEHDLVIRLSDILCGLSDREAVDNVDRDRRVANRPFHQIAALGYLTIF